MIIQLIYNMYLLISIFPLEEITKEITKSIDNIQVLLIYKRIRSFTNYMGVYQFYLLHWTLRAHSFESVIPGHSLD